MKKATKRARFTVLKDAERQPRGRRKSASGRYEAKHEVLNGYFAFFSPLLKKG